MNKQEWLDRLEQVKQSLDDWYFELDTLMVNDSEGGWTTEEFDEDMNRLRLAQAAVDQMKAGVDSMTFYRVYTLDPENWPSIWGPGDTLIAEVGTVDEARELCEFIANAWAGQGKNDWHWENQYRNTITDGKNQLVFWIDNRS